MTNGERHGSPEPVEKDSLIGSAFADRRGGPSTLDGVKYQALTSAIVLMDWIADVRGALGSGGIFRCEPRWVFGDRQVGFDVGQAFDGGDDVLVEVKSNPTASDVSKFVADAKALFDGLRSEGSETEGFTLVFAAARATVAFNALDRLVRHAGEATDDDHFRRLVEGADDQAEADLSEALGGTPLAVAQMIAVPQHLDAESCRRRALNTAMMLAPGGRGMDLLHRLLAEVTEGGARREGLRVERLMADLREDGLLVDMPTVDPSLLPRSAVVARVILDECPLPLPIDVLAEALECTSEEAETTLAEFVEAGMVLFDASLVMSLPGASRFDTSLGLDAAVRALMALCARARSQKEAFAHQAPNALALAKMLRPRRPEVVADAFVAFDKTTKAWGDLSVTFELAQISERAIVAATHELTDGDDAGRRRLGSLRAQTFICGHGWVLQRVDELDHASDYMNRAESMASFGGDDENAAFALKCNGRLRRLQAEALDLEDPDRDRLLGESAELLRQARKAFCDLMPRSSRSLDEDYGECVSLLARTQAVQGDTDVAAETADEAASLLEKNRTSSKAYADLTILRAEIDSARHPADASTVRDSHDGPLRDLIVRFGDSWNHSKSEIAARARFVLAGLNLRAGDSEAAAVLWQEAMEQYDALGCERRRDSVEWTALLASGDVSADLIEVLEEMDAEPGARVRACRHYSKVAHINPTGASLRDLVQKAIADHAAEQSEWAERAASA